MQPKSSSLVSRLGLAWLFCLALLATPLMAAELQPEKDFRVITPPLPLVTVTSKDGANQKTPKATIEVTELFWYGCSHCFDFEPVISEWVKTLPPDVRFRRQPAIFPSNKWVPAARLFFTLEAMNLLDGLHTDIFNVIHLDRARLDDEKTLFAWIATKSIDVIKFKAIWNSAAIQTRVQEAKEISLKSGATGVPGVIVQGRYLAISNGNYGELLQVVDQLIARVRAESSPK